MKVFYTEKSYADNRFLSKGVELQMDSNSWEKAKHNYTRSCMLCCTRGIGAVQCAHCPIRQALLTNAVIFRKKLSKRDWDWVQKERELR